MTAALKPVIGLVGGIGAGKSFVAEALAKRGGRIVAGDPLGHEALEQPEIKARVLEVWGERGIVAADGRIDRKALGRIVFPSPVERSRLEHLTHPFIERRILDEIATARAIADVRFVVLDAAILLEAEWDGPCDKLIYVDAPRPVRLARVKAQRAWTEADLAAREAVQMPAERKKGLADAVVENGGPPADTLTQVDSLLKAWNLA